jgi:hypothetical protein
MSSLLILALAAAQPQAVVTRMPSGPQAMLEAEIVQRPAGTASEALIGALAAEAGAGGWQRVVQEMEGPPFRFTMTGFRNPAGGSPLAFYSVAGEDPARPGKICRVRMRAQPGAGEGDEVARISRFCLEGIAPFMAVDPARPLPRPQRR